MAPKNQFTIEVGNQRILCRHDAQTELYSGYGGLGKFHNKAPTLEELTTASGSCVSLLQSSDYTFYTVGFHIVTNLNFKVIRPKHYFGFKTVK